MEIQLKGNYTLRDFLYGDALDLAKHGNNIKIAANLRHNFPSPYTIDYARNWIYNAKKYEQGKRFCIAHNNKCIGDIGFVIGIGVYRFNAEVGYWLSEDHWGKGVMKTALYELCRHAFATFQIVRMFADVQDRNIASCKILESAGFKREAVLRKHMYKDGEFLDQYIYGLLKQNFGTK
jgi:RimJ/RimL family protein N-acetyltransferase